MATVDASASAGSNNVLAIWPITGTLFSAETVPALIAIGHHCTDQRADGHADAVFGKFALIESGECVHHLDLRTGNGRKIDNRKWDEPEPGRPTRIATNECIRFVHALRHECLLAMIAFFDEGNSTSKTQPQQEPQLPIRTQQTSHANKCLSTSLERSSAWPLGRSAAVAAGRFERAMSATQAGISTKKLRLFKSRINRANSCKRNALWLHNHPFPTGRQFMDFRKPLARLAGRTTSQ